MATTSEPATGEINHLRSENRRLWERLTELESERAALRDRVAYIEGAIESLTSSLGAFMESWRDSILATSPLRASDTTSGDRPVVGE